MKLLSVFENQEGYKEVWKNFTKRFNHIQVDDFVEEHHGTSTRSTMTHYGKLYEGVEISALELAMVLNGGYGWFGGSITLDDDGNFKCEIHID